MSLRKFLRRIRHRVLKRLRRGRYDTTAALSVRHDLRGRFCANPFRQLDVYENGQLHQCCAAWLPTPVGNLKRDSMAEAWNSDAAQRIRASVLEGSFRYCDHQVCPAIQAGTLPTVEQASRDPRLADIIEQGRTRIEDLPEFINLCNDASCNLWCPSCREDRILHTEGPGFERRAHLQDRIVQSLFAEPTDRRFCISVTGSGDPFASKVFRNFLFDLDGRDFPNLEINLQTNGVLLTPRTWERLVRIRDKVTSLLVSFDAATPETYSITRRGGHWPTLLDNVRALGEFRRRGELNFLRMDFVVQQANYREMPAFVELAKELGADRVGFSLLMDWGTWAPAEFRVRCVWRTDHPEFEAFLEVLRDPGLADPMVDLGNVQPYRDRALALSEPSPARVRA